MFNVCKTCFEKFFDKEEVKKHNETLERALNFKDRLYGNLNFVGELYRRKILPEQILVTVFNSLLGKSDINQDETVNDLHVEGAINLMNKVGYNYEANVKASSKKNQSDK